MTAVRALLTAVARDPTVRLVVAAGSIWLVAVAVLNGGAGAELRAQLEDVVTAEAQTSAAIAAGATVVEGVPAEEYLEGLHATERAIRRDLHHASLAGGVGALLALASTAWGATVATALGATVVGRQFPQRTWPLLLGPLGRTRTAGVLLGAAWALAAITVAAGIAVGTLAGLGAAVAAGHVEFGAPEASFPLGLVSSAVLLWLWVCVGAAAASLTRGPLSGIVGAWTLILADGFASTNLPAYAGWLLSPRVAGVAALWTEVTPEGQLLRGQTTSYVWWSAFEGHPIDSPGGALLGVTVAVVILTVLVQRLVRSLERRP